MGPETHLALYRTMVAIRGFESATARFLTTGLIGGGIHLSLGQEAVAAGVCHALRDDDMITTTHRGHGHCLAKGADPERMFAELFGRLEGYCKGKAGSMHIADPRKGILGATAIVGGGLPMALGAAFSAQLRGTDQVAVAFFGEGAVAQGIFHESLNLAALWRLPVVFVCENNQYAELTHVSVHLAAPVDRLAAAHGIPGLQVDGNDVESVVGAALDCVARARGGEGPALLECETYRFSGHYVGDPERYRTSEEVESWRARDPLVLLRSQLAQTYGEEALAAIDREIEAELEAAAERALASPEAGAEVLLEDVYASGRLV